MKPTTRVLEVDSTLQGENIAMGIDTSAMAHIMSILTDLYSDPELAVIREYSTNAFDAHRDAGNPLPIDVTLPTALSPFFRVRDYGDGLDADDIRDIYSRYGTSTKRDSNDVVGMLGLGCKSALTYTDQFTLIGTKNGRTVQVSVHRDEDGAGSMTIVSDEPAGDRASGVEVIVPAKRDNGFEDKAAEFFRFWTPGTVLVNGEQPAWIGDDPNLTWLMQDKLGVLTGRKNDYYRQGPMGWVVMGNVAYPLPEPTNEDEKNRPFSIVAFVNIGEVNFTPSREALQLTKLTKDTLLRLTDDVKRELTAAMQREVSQAATPHEAILAAQRAERSGVKIDDLTYKGKTVPATFERKLILDAAPGTGQPREFLVVGGNRYGRKSGDRFRELPAYGTSRVYFVNFTAQEYSTAKREKFDAWLATDAGKKALPEGRPAQMVLVDALTADERFWTTGTPVLDWTPIQETKVVKAGTVGPSWKARPRGSYELAGHYGKHVEAENIDLTVPLVYIHTSERHDRRRWERLMTEATLLVMPANRLEKFQRDFPHALHYREHIKKEATDWLNQQAPALVEAAKYKISGVGSRLAGLDPTKIHDPDLARYVIAQNDKTCDPVVAGITTRPILGIDKYDLQSKYPDPLKGYPLVQDALLNSAKRDHFYLYVNAVYAAGKES